MGSPFKMNPGSKPGSNRDRGMMQMSERGLVKGMDQGPKMHKGVKHDPRSGDKLPSYEVKSSSESISKATPAKTTTTYKKPTKTAKGDAAYAALTPSARKAQDDKYKKLNTRSEVTLGSLPTRRTVDKTKTVTLGKETANQVAKRGKENISNEKGKRNAEREAAFTKGKADSTAVQTTFRKAQKKRSGGSISQGAADIGTGMANMAGRKALKEAGIGSKEQVANFSTTKDIRSGKGAGKSGKRAEKMD